MFLICAINIRQGTCKGYLTMGSTLAGLLGSLLKQEKPLIITGARQVGKSTLIKLFVQQELQTRSRSTHKISELAKFSIDDNFTDQAKLVSLPLYATEYLKNKIDKF